MSKHSSLTTITPFSKLLAMSLFIFLPLLTFYLGVQYGLATAVLSPLLPTTTSLPVPKSCSEEAKLCPDGSYVFKTLPDCTFRACPVTQTAGNLPVPSKMLGQFQTKEDQIAFQLSQRTGISPDALLISYVNNQETAKKYAGGSFVTKINPTTQYFFATFSNGLWLVTAVSQNTPKCSEINPYSYPKTLVPACKDAKNTIIAR